MHDKMGNGVRGFLAYMGCYGGGLNRAGRQCPKRALYAMHDKMEDGVRGFPAYMGCWGGGGGKKAFGVFLSENT